MLFPTFGFLAFFLVVFVGFWYVFRRNLERRIFLILASYFFYACWDWRYCALLFLSSAANYGFALAIARNRDYAWRKFFLALSVAFNLLVLGFFKYYGFFADSANSLIRLAFGGGAGFFFPAIRVMLPVGISFYTFKAMSYVFDVYLCAIPATRFFPDVLLYVSFFPQIASGPIVHARDFIPQIAERCDAGRDPDDRPIRFSRASSLILSGLVKKSVFANFISTLFVDQVLASPSQYGGLEVFLALIGYSVVIYCDFSGYSDMAIGVALLLGFDTPKNFDRPYAAFSVTEFWKRWHITFSSWLREYLYFSFGGSRFGVVRTLFALFATMVLGGLWHGASVTFLAWGALQGLSLAVERLAGIGDKPGKRPVVTGLRVALTFLFTTCCWLVFRSPSLSAARDALVALGNFSPALTLASPLVVILIVLGLAMHGIPGRLRRFASGAWEASPAFVKGIGIAATLAVLAIVSMSGVPPFIYFQF